MFPVRVDTTIRRGDSFRLGFRLSHVDEETGDPVYDYNFTGHTGLSQLRRSADDPVVLLTFTVAIADQGVTPGLVWITATDEQTADLEEESGVYDVQLTSPTGDVMTLVEGDAEIRPDVSR